MNLEWVQPDGGEHQIFAAHSDVDDGAGHLLVTSYALKRPDGQWSLLLVNRDQEVAHKVRISFRGEGGAESGFAGPVEIATFGGSQYRWYPARTRFMAHAEQSAQSTVVAETEGRANPDGPIVRQQRNASSDTEYELPAASVVVIRGKIQLNRGALASADYPASTF